MPASPAVLLRFFDALVGAEVSLWGDADAAVTAGTSAGLGTVSALGVIAGHGDDARVQDVADGIGITVGAASKLVDRLERDGLVVRAPNPSDRRSSLLRMTADGRRVLDDGSGVLVHVLGERLAGLDETTLASATEVLESLQG
ncbi:MarR family winged helix-turn-helix transcriptional regulator [Microbacterium sp. NPDC055683]